MKSVVKTAVVAMVALQCTTDAAPASQNLRATWGGGGGGGGGFISSLIQSCLNGYGLWGNSGGGGGNAWGGGGGNAWGGGGGDTGATGKGGW